MAITGTDSANQNMRVLVKELEVDGVPVEGGTIPTVDFATVSALVGDWRGEGNETLLAALTALQGA